MTRSPRLEILVLFLLAMGATPLPAQEAVREQAYLLQLFHAQSVGTVRIARGGSRPHAATIEAEFRTSPVLVPQPLALVREERILAFLVVRGGGPDEIDVTWIGKGLSATEVREGDELLPFRIDRVERVSRPGEDRSCLVAPDVVSRIALGIPPAGAGGPEAFLGALSRVQVPQGPVVGTVLPGSPAERMGLAPRDVLVSMGGAPCGNWASVDLWSNPELLFAASKPERQIENPTLVAPGGTIGRRFEIWYQETASDQEPYSIQALEFSLGE